ncbi:hypothetical protein GDO78_003668 [Eleutherodactylus coqui]|uniref:Uncharacterized protein n=1 Tax=Eleutherodactylus coqui TaxID=57060 RepID=A0A8J6ETI0_ELECQ|nr:hypothetical protein GDO78_003668 [Eleutherodactylus coqui]
MFTSCLSESSQHTSTLVILALEQAYSTHIPSCNALTGISVDILYNGLTLSQLQQHKYDFMAKETCPNLCMCNKGNQSHQEHTFSLSTSFWNAIFPCRYNSPALHDKQNPGQI